jgi:hypothetical protein
MDAKLFDNPNDKPPTAFAFTFAFELVLIFILVFMLLLVGEENASIILVFIFMFMLLELVGLFTDVVECDLPVSRSRSRSSPNATGVSDAERDGKIVILASFELAYVLLFILKFALG